MGKSVYTINNPTNIHEWQNAIEDLQNEQKRELLIQKGIENVQQFDIKALSEKRTQILEKVERNLQR